MSDEQPRESRQPWQPVDDDALMLAARLLRTGICMSTSSFDNEYSVRTVGADTFLDVKQATIMFTFKKRP